MPKIHPLLIIALRYTATIYFSMATTTVQGQDQIFYLKLAERWAPTLYHATNPDYQYRAEYITRVDFDGDWLGTNNWENLDQFPLKAYLYYDVVESDTHWYIQYHAFHPRDDGPPLDRHENDFEGAIFAIAKSKLNAFGELQAVLTLAHDRFYSYSHLPAFALDADGPLLFDKNGQPKLYIQANGFTYFNKGHGWYHYQDQDALDEEGIIYYYGGRADEPAQGSGHFTTRTSYALLPLDELFQQRSNPQLFYQMGIMRGDTYGENKAKMPWYWDDPSDGPVFHGAMYCDPIQLFQAHFSGFKHLDKHYISNNNYTHKIRLNHLLLRHRSFADRSVYLTLEINEQVYWDESAWKKDAIKLGQTYPIYQVDFPRNDLYLVAPTPSNMRIAIMEKGFIKDQLLDEVELSLEKNSVQQGPILTDQGYFELDLNVLTVH